MTDIAETELLQALEVAFAAYQRRYGRERALAKLSHMLARGQEAQRVMDAGLQRMGSPVPRAAE